jgi:propanediol dehydratase small subunit
VAESVQRPQLAENLRRAAELVAMPEEEILAVYTLLRPGRATREEMHRVAAEIEQKYNATRCAAMIREAAGSV